MNDREISELFDRLVLETGQKARDDIVRHITEVLTNKDFSDRATSFLLANGSYYRPPSNESHERFKAFENRQCKLNLFPNSKEVRKPAAAAAAQQPSRLTSRLSCMLWSPMLIPCLPVPSSPTVVSAGGLAAGWEGGVGGRALPEQVPAAGGAQGTARATCIPAGPVEARPCYGDGREGVRLSILL